MCLYWRGHTLKDLDAPADAKGMSKFNLHITDTGLVKPVATVELDESRLTKIDKDSAGFTAKFYVERVAPPEPKFDVEYMHISLQQERGWQTSYIVNVPYDKAVEEISAFLLESKKTGDIGRYAYRIVPA